MRPIRFDLQSHSTVSDGALAPAGVVRAAARAGIELLALTDHDATEGVDEALAAGAREGIRVVPAAELSSLDDAHEDFHVCAYLVDHHSPAWVAALGAFRADRLARGLRMADALEEAGLALDRAPLERAPPRDAPSGARTSPRPSSTPGERGPAGRRGGLRTVGTSSRPYLIPARRATAADDARGRRGRRAHPRRGRRRGLGAPVLGPGRAPAWCWATLERFAALGMDGVEAFYVTAHGGADPPARRPGAGARAADHGLGRLPRARARAVQPLRALRPARLEPALGPIAQGT
jgi:hypothetical protein